MARLDEIAMLAYARTLAALMAGSVRPLAPRKREPTRQQVFHTSLAWVIAPIARVGCL